MTVVRATGQLPGGSGLVWWRGGHSSPSRPCRVPCAFLGRRDMTADTRSSFTARRYGGSSVAWSEMIRYFNGTEDRGAMMKNQNTARSVVTKLIPLHPFSWPELCLYSVCNQPATQGQLSLPSLRGRYYINEHQLRLERQRQVWFIPLADERGVCR